MYWSDLYSKQLSLFQSCRASFSKEIKLVHSFALDSKRARSNFPCSRISRTIKSRIELQDHRFCLSNNILALVPTDNFSSRNHGARKPPPDLQSHISRY